VAKMLTLYEMLDALKAAGSPRYEVLVGQLINVGESAAEALRNELDVTSGDPHYDSEDDLRLCCAFSPMENGSPVPEVFSKLDIDADWVVYDGPYQRLMPDRCYYNVASGPILPCAE